jgi:ankyrin repeat protein
MLKIEDNSPASLGQALRRSAAMGLNQYIPILSVEVCINQKDNKKNGRTALHWAIIGKHINCVDQLLRLGANISIKDNHGKTPLQYNKTKKIKEVARHRIMSSLNLFASNKESQKNESLSKKICSYL